MKLENLCEVLKQALPKAKVKCQYNWLDHIVIVMDDKVFIVQEGNSGDIEPE